MANDPRRDVATELSVVLRDRLSRFVLEVVGIADRAGFDLRDEAVELETRVADRISDYGMHMFFAENTYYADGLKRRIFDTERRFRRRSAEKIGLNKHLSDVEVCLDQYCKDMMKTVSAVEEIVLTYNAANIPDQKSAPIRARIDNGRLLNQVVPAEPIATSYEYSQEVEYLRDRARLALEMLRDSNCPRSVISEFSLFASFLDEIDASTLVRLYLHTEACQAILGAIQEEIRPDVYASLISMLVAARGFTNQFKSVEAYRQHAQTWHDSAEVRGVLEAVAARAVVTLENDVERVDAAIPTTLRWLQRLASTSKDAVFGLVTSLGNIAIALARFARSALEHVGQKAVEGAGLAAKMITGTALVGIAVAFLGDLLPLATLTTEYQWLRQLEPLFKAWEKFIK
jgi:hypothetical protein